MRACGAHFHGLRLAKAVAAALLGGCSLPSAPTVAAGCFCVVKLENDCANDEKASWIWSLTALGGALAVLAADDAAAAAAVLGALLSTTGTAVASSGTGAAAAAGAASATIGAAVDGSDSCGTSSCSVETWCASVGWSGWDCESTSGCGASGDGGFEFDDGGGAIGETGDVGGGGDMLLVLGDGERVAESVPADCAVGSAPAAAAGVAGTLPGGCLASAGMLPARKSDSAGTSEKRSTTERPASRNASSLVLAMAAPSSEIGRAHV